MKRSIKARLLLTTYVHNVRTLSPCSLSMSTTSEEECLPWASLSRPNRSRFLSSFDLHAFDRKHVAQAQRVFLSFTRTPAARKRRTRNNALRVQRSPSFLYIVNKLRKLQVCTYVRRLAERRSRSPIHVAQSMHGFILRLE